MTPNQIKIFYALCKIIKDENLNDVNHALAATLTFGIARCISPSEYRDNIKNVVNSYADWFYENRNNNGHIELKDIPIDNNTIQ